MTIEEIAARVAHADGRHTGIVFDCPVCIDRETLWRLVMSGYVIGRLERGNAA